MTPHQRNLLRAAAAPGGTKCNAHAQRSIEKLEALGFVKSTVKVQPDALRGRHTLLYIVVATAAGKAAL